MFLFQSRSPFNLEILVPARRSYPIFTVAILPVLLNDSLRAVASLSWPRRVGSGVLAPRCRLAPQEEHVISARISGSCEEQSEVFPDRSTTESK